MSLFHPNRISTAGVGLIGVGTALSAAGRVEGLGFLALGYACDGIDGIVARTYNMQTEEGARLDPLADKQKMVIHGAGIVADAFNPMKLVSYLTTVSADMYSQLSRSEKGWRGLVDMVKEQYRATVHPETCTPDGKEVSSTRANYWGKIKTGIHIAVNLAYSASQVLPEKVSALLHLPQEQLGEVMNTVVTAGYFVAAALCIKGVAERKKLR